MRAMCAAVSGEKFSPGEAAVRISMRAMCAAVSGEKFSPGEAAVRIGMRAMCAAVSGGIRQKTMGIRHVSTDDDVHVFVNVIWQ
jgi:hypothetical protein